jgi:hypothetical protein
MKKTLTILALTASLGLSANAASARPALQPDGLTGPNTQQAGLLLPAVQAAREAARRSTTSSSAPASPLVGLLLPAVQSAHGASNNDNQIAYAGPNAGPQSAGGGPHVRVFSGSTANVSPGGLPRGM